MSPRSSLPILLSALAALALAGPATVTAGEAAPSGTAPTGATTEGSAPPSSGEAQPSTGATTGATPPPAPASSAPAAEPAPPQVQAQLSQGSSPGVRPARRHAPVKAKAPLANEGSHASEAAPTLGAKKAASPSALTPSLPLALESSITGVPSFFIESFRIPPFLLPIYQAAGTAYDVPWQVLAAINEVETDYGRDLSVSSAGAEGWMQFLPSEWAQYGVDANGDGVEDPYNPADAIFAAARYLHAAGLGSSIREAVYSYNHSQAYVESVMLRARLLGGTPAELLGAITALTEAHFPVHAAAHFTDGFAAAPAAGATSPGALVGTTIDTVAGAPVIAVQDGQVVQIGRSAALGRFLRLRDAFGNTYTYSQLGRVSSVYPVLEPRLHSLVSARITRSVPGGERAPSGPATAGAQPRSPVSESGLVAALSGSLDGLEAAPSPAVAPAPARAAHPVRPPRLRSFSEGSEEVYLHTLRAGVQVIAGTVLGHVGGGPQPHIFFQIRPAGLRAPLIDPKPILDGWVALENTSVFHAKGENPFLATSPTIGQVLLESKQQLEPQVLHDGGIRLSRCGRQDVGGGRVDKRVLAMLEYLSVSGLKPTVGGLPCAAGIRGVAATAGTSEAVDITAVNGVPVAGHQGQGSIADTTVRKLLMLQGLNRPRRVLSQMSYPGSSGAIADPHARAAIRVEFALPGGANAHSASIDSVLSPSEWTELIARLGEIPDPVVGRGPSTAAIPDPATATQGGAGGNR